MCRCAMLKFIKLFDMDYAKSFTCSTCAELQHSELVFIIDGKEMGMCPVKAIRASLVTNLWSSLFDISRWSSMTSV